MTPMNRPEEGSGGTRLESFEEIREAASGVRRPATVKEAARGPAPDGVPFRPVRRPPMALLCILDDGRDDGEWVRVRSERVVIGRTDGDIRIPHDDMMSGRHAELFRQVSGDRFRWHLKDLGSTNGTYVRISNTLIRNGQEFLIGTRRFRFGAGMQAAALLEEAAAAAADASKGTRGWQAVSPTDLIPSIVELTPHGEGQRIYLNKEEHGIGRDPAQCDILLSDDLMVSSRHARLYRDEKDRWHLENTASRNGVWLRVDKMTIDSSAQFQLGEQRFLVKVL
jgi:pSer/pThr/pTyr-binding forkhead associated (FHA) protein